jgi:hypothetical protein
LKNETTPAATRAFQKTHEELMTKQTYPRLIRRQVHWDAPPPAGARHRWLMTATLQLKRQGVVNAEIHRILETDLITAGRRPQPREIENTLAKADQMLDSPARSYNVPPRTPPWPEASPDRIAEAESTACDCADLLEHSPVRFEAPAPAEIMRLLFADEALLCLGTGEGNSRGPVVGVHRDLRSDIAAGRFRYVVPNPMSAPTGLTADGRPSPRAKSNTGPRIFAVIEWDCPSLELDQQARRLWFLATVTRFPLRLAMLSGGKSVHGWFDVAGAADVAVRDFYREASRLGCDVCGYGSPHQWFRIPDATRENGNCQAALYVNPHR